MPAILGAVSGFFFGGAILDPNKVRTTGWAAVRGAIAALSTWLMFAVVMTIYTYSRNNRENLVGLFIWFLLLLTLAIGWLISGVGSVIGILLFKFRSQKPYI